MQAITPDAMNGSIIITPIEQTKRPPSPPSPEKTQGVNAPENETLDAEARKSKRREQNRAAQAKARKRQKQVLEELKTSDAKNRQQIGELEEEIRKLRGEVGRIKSGKKSSSSGAVSGGAGVPRHTESPVEETPADTSPSSATPAQAWASTAPSGSGGSGGSGKDVTQAFVPPPFFSINSSGMPFPFYGPVILPSGANFTSYFPGSQATASSSSSSSTASASLGV